MNLKTKTKSLKSNMIMNSLLTISVLIFPLITFPYASRVLLEGGIGRVSFVTSVLTYFSMFAQLGIPTYGISACVKVRDNKEELSRVTHEILFINLVMCVIVYAALFISILVVPKFQPEKELFLVYGITIGLNAIGVEWLYKGLEQYSYITIRSVIFKVISLIPLFLFVRTENDYVMYAAVMIFAASASNILNLFNLRKLIYLHPVGNYHLKRHMRYILIFFGMSVATVIYSNLDTVMLGFMTNVNEVGYYTATVKIKSILVGLVTSSSAVLLPRMTQYIETGKKDEFHRIANKTMSFVLLISVPLSVYFMIFAKEGIDFLSGPSFANSVFPMQIIMPTLIFIGITNVLGIQIMIPIGKEKQVLYSEIAGAVTDLILNAILIPKLGTTGAAIGTLVAEFVVLIWQFFAVHELAVEMLSQIRYFLLIIAIVLSSIASFWVKYLGLSSFWTMVISGGIFFGVYLIVMLIGKERILIEVFGQLKRKLKRK